MRTTSATAAQDRTRDQILDAAEARFRVYGYRKTTMAEIAEDVGMSAANLYRYFDNKGDICAACAGRCLGARVDVLREAVRRPGLGAAERLEAFVLATLRHTREQASDQPKINELVESVTSERPDLVREKLAAIEALLAEVLAYGNETGEFQVDDVIATAATVHATLVLFEVPIFAALYPAQRFEALASSVARLLVRGLARR